ncbi:MAG TPA: LPS assembly protein LptD, partial [bacterium]
MIRASARLFPAGFSFVLILACFAFGQEADTSAIPPVQPDTSRTKSADLDTTISYSARNIEFVVDQKRMLLTGNARIRYKAMTLSAEKIAVDWDQNLVTAEGVADTIWADSLNTVVDSIFVKGEPIFAEADQEITGSRMTYNLKSRRGRITEGTTQYLDGYYWGEALKKDTTEVLYAGPGHFTTCSNNEPHYTFRSQQMKLIVNDKAVAKPVVLYFKDVPVAAIPFGVFPSRTGRQSGLIIPTYGESSTQGRFLHHLGYYYAPSDYYDVAATMDYYERTGFLFHGNARYNWRYHLSGYMQGAITRQHLEAQKKRRWEIKLGHDQTIDPNTHLKVDANFVSDQSYYQQYSFNLNEQLAQTLRSDATLTHTFPGGKNSMSFNLHHEQNLQSEDITQDIPRINFRRGQSNLIPRPVTTPGDTAGAETEWYHNFTYSYSSEFWHRRILDETISATDTTLVQDRRSAAKHSIGLNGPQSIGYFSVNPSLSYNEQWFDEYQDYSNNPEGEKIIGFRARRTFSTGLGLNTKLYGFWTNPFPGVDAIRHTATPTLSLSFAPDFSDPAWGYYQEITDSTGQTQKKDRFTGSLYGSTPQGKSLALNFQLANLFQMKYGAGEEKDKMKVDLFTLNFSTGYNFVADSLRFAPLSSSFRATPLSGAQPLGPLKNISFDLSTSHSFYKFGSAGEYNEYYYDPLKGKLLRLRSFDVSTNAGLSIGALIHSLDKARGEGEESSEFGAEFAPAESDTVFQPTFEAQPPPGP